MSHYVNKDKTKRPMDIGTWTCMTRIRRCLIRIQAEAETLKTIREVEPLCALLPNQTEQKACKAKFASTIKKLTEDEQLAKRWAQNAKEYDKEEEKELARMDKEEDAESRAMDPDAQDEEEEDGEDEDEDEEEEED